MKNSRIDQADGIALYLQDGIEGLHRLAKERSKAADREEPLSDWIIMGRWHLFADGNIGPCEIELEHEPLTARLPPVLARQKLYDVLSGISIRTSLSEWGLPPSSKMTCPSCHRAWTLEDARAGVHISKSDRLTPLSEGRTVRAFEEELNAANAAEALFRFGPEPMVRNEKYIDRSPGDGPGDVVNDKGWRFRHPPLKGERLTLDYVAEGGDWASVTVFQFQHVRCHRITLAVDGRKRFADMLEKAGVTFYSMRPIENGYWPKAREYDSVRDPWWVVELPYGEITIGWRKRVIDIDWSTTKRDLSALFTAEDVTKDKHGIHAWGYDKAADYLARIHKALCSDSPGGRKEEP